MSSTTTGFSGEQQRGVAQAPMGIDYIPTEEEKRVFKECNQESFRYRALPLSMAGMAIAQALVTKGILSTSSRFGSLPKVAFAGLCGYAIGKMSYMKTCQEKFKRLENSPLGEALRQRTGGQLSSGGPQSELSNPETPSFDPMFQPAEAPGQSPSHSRDFEYGFRPDAPMQSDSDFSAPASSQSYLEEEQPRRKPILYEDLRLKNRENYEVTLTQKAETLLKSPPENQYDRPRKEVKKNIYGDAWED